MLLGPRSLQCLLMWTDIINDRCEMATGGGAVCVWENGRKRESKEEKMRKHGEPHLMQLMCRFM